MNANDMPIHLKDSDPEAVKAKVVGVMTKQMLSLSMTLRLYEQSCMPDNPFTNKKYQRIIDNFKQELERFSNFIQTTLED